MAKGNPELLPRRQANENALLVFLYEAFPVRIPFRFRVNEIAPKLKVSEGIVRDALTTLEKAEVAKREIRGGTSPGRELWVTLLLDVDAAIDKLHALHEHEKIHGSWKNAGPNGTRKNHRTKKTVAAPATAPVAPATGASNGLNGAVKTEAVIAPQDVRPSPEDVTMTHEPEPEPEPAVTVATSDREETRAIAGPEPDRRAGWAPLAPARKLDDAEALIAAARIYRDRATKIESKIRELQTLATELGVTNFDPAALVASLHFERDERLELVAKLLPTIDALETRVKRLGETIAANRDKVLNYDRLAQEHKKLSDRNSSLTGQLAQLRQQQLARSS